MNVDNLKLGLRKIRIGLNLLIDFYLSNSSHRPQLIRGPNKQLLSLFVICEPSNVFVVALVNSALTYYRGMTIVNGWPILNKPVNY